MLNKREMSYRNFTISLFELKSYYISVILTQ